MDMYRDVYERLDALPKEKRISLLMEILPPQELFARTDGFRCLIRAFGLRIFETSAMLSEAGIPESDPRAEVFRTLRGGLIDRKIPNALRAVAARQETVCRRVGAIQVWEGGRRAWWVPLAATSRFETAIGGLIQTFAHTRDRLLLADYHRLRSEAEERWFRASEAAYDNMRSLGRTQGLLRGQFLQRSMQAFRARFPTETDVREKIRMELVPIDRSLPEAVENILQDVREAERIRHEIEAERDREQLRLVEIERKIRDEQLGQLQHERRARDRILREAIHPQIEQAQQVVAQVQASLLRVAREITTTISRGGDISAATRRSWSQRLKALTALAPGNVPLERALEDLSRLSRKGEAPSTRHLEITSRSVQRALAELERRASLELNADQIWQLMREGRGEESLQRIASLRKRLKGNLSEVEALWEMVVEIGARNEVIIEECLVPAC